MTWRAKGDRFGDKINPSGFAESIYEAFNKHIIFIAPLLSGARI
ncbi:hypothetical protein SynROS8604_00240 [Synechococcus sp. ROS8604]|nr:hypothetical protein SynROS8604_00240 [Synechococcus sp. ROS8604]